MGNYANCWVDDSLIWSDKSSIDTRIISLFSQQNKIVTSGSFSSLPAHFEDYREELKENPELKVIYYETNIEEALDQLELLGYDLETAKDADLTWEQGEQVTPCDPLVIIRLSIKENSRKLIYDFTDLVRCGYYQVDEDFTEFAYKPKQLS